MTGTLPPSAESILRGNLFFTCARILRTDCDRPNLRYCVQSIKHETRGDKRIGPLDILLHAALNVCRQDLRDWQRGTEATARGICFVRNKGLGGKLASSLGCHLYTGDLSDTVRERVSTAWNLGYDSPYIVTTAAFGAGVDYPSVRRVLHLDTPSGLLDYAQETGRAG